MLRRNIYIYGVGGLIAPFIGIKAHRPHHPIHPRDPIAMARFLVVTPSACCRTADTDHLHGHLRGALPAGRDGGRPDPRPQVPCRRLAHQESTGKVVGSKLIGQSLHRQERQPAGAVLPVATVRGRCRLRPHRVQRVQPRPGVDRRHAARPDGQGRHRHAAPADPGVQPQPRHRQARRRRRLASVLHAGRGRCGARGLLRRSGLHRARSPGSSASTRPARPSRSSRPTRA